MVARHLISTDDLTDDDLMSIVDSAVEFGEREADPRGRLPGVVAGIYFRKTSTRTRAAFSTGALRLGAQLVSFGPGELQTNTGETSEDTGRVFSRMLDVLVARTAERGAEMRAWAQQDRMSVINAMSHEEHPTQALADLTTLQRQFKRIDDLRVLYVGEGNNTAASLALSLTRYPGTYLELRTPPGYGLSEDVSARATALAARSGATVIERHHMVGLPLNLDAVYTTRWETTGTIKTDPDWRVRFAPFQVTGELWEHSPKAVFLHDLPARRGEEVTADVLDGPMSIAFDQAENKLHSAMAILQWCR
ncbi:ornithine carbamoyltransferase [Amycolatopsis magusensis]|uniref:Ornithine carbamoyltransferase n=1 Tax=Amycolatopsis magusensis TaxID=882444 RepID=A0ABS4PVY7_9PSEU|nr:ornithine carbamoyltransferase [Amycolatopsis magusensis]MBP2183589.1 ornithine carbamoyltransferase [Amycolatopsis magusensis]MDI5975008.1 ornithine carbamoyltransferase [Amycolatopsis magusensis]